MQIVEHFREFVWLPPPPSTRTRLRNGNRLDKKREEHRKSFDLMGNVFIWKQLQSPPRRRIIKAGSFKHNLKGKDIMETKMRMCVEIFNRGEGQAGEVNSSHWGQHQVQP